jgi:citrate synthase
LLLLRAAAAAVVAAASRATTNEHAIADHSCADKLARQTTRRLPDDVVDDSFDAALVRSYEHESSGSVSTLHDAPARELARSWYQRPPPHRR